MQQAKTQGIVFLSFLLYLFTSFVIIAFFHLLFPWQGKGTYQYLIPMGLFLVNLLVMKFNRKKYEIVFIMAHMPFIVCAILSYLDGHPYLGAISLVLMLTPIFFHSSTSANNIVNENVNSFGSSNFSAIKSTQSNHATNPAAFNNETTPGYTTKPVDYSKCFPSIPYNSSSKPWNSFQPHMKQGTTWQSGSDIYNQKDGRVGRVDSKGNIYNSNGNWIGKKP